MFRQKEKYEIYWSDIGLNCGLKLDLRRFSKSIWDNILLECKYIPVNYTCSSIDFQKSYQQNKINKLHDLSSIIYWNNKPIAIWPLSLTEIAGNFFLDSHGLPVQPPLFVNSCPRSSRMKIIKRCLRMANLLSFEVGVSSWDSRESFTESLGLSDWHLVSMHGGSTCVVTHDLFINLESSIAEIKNGFRKSYKSLINSGLKHWSVDVLDKLNTSVWHQFHELHIGVAGRKTRSNGTWDIHENDIAEGRGFLVYLSNNKGEMEGAGFFKFTRDEGLYAVAAYRRNLFDKPLGHIVQYRAIEELKQRGIRWYKLGRRPFHSETPDPSNKEVSIGEFKQGFASHLFPRYKLTHKVSNNGASDN